MCTICTSKLTLAIVEDSECISVLMSKELSHHNIRVLLNQTKISENVNKLNIDSGSVKLLCSTLNQLNVKYHQISDQLKWIVEWRPWNSRGWQTTKALYLAWCDTWLHLNLQGLMTSWDMLPVHPVPLYLGCHLSKYSLESRGPQGAFPNLNAVYISMGNALEKCLGLELHFDFFCILSLILPVINIITWYCGCVGASVFQGRTSLFQTHLGGRVQKLSQSCAAA